MIKRYVQILAVVIIMVMVAVPFAGCSKQEAPAPAKEAEAPAAPAKSLKIGLLTPLTGTFAANGIDMRDGLNMFLDEKGRELAGYKAEVVLEDTEGNPATALVKARKLVEKDKVDVIVGPLLASSGYAVAEYCAQNKVPLLLAIVSGEDLTQRTPSDYVIRTGWTSAQPMHPFAEYVYKELGYKKVVGMAYDFAFGHEVISGFHRTFEEMGGKVVKKLWSPIGTPDFGPYLSQIPDDVDAVVVNFSGADAMRFVKQYEEFGFKDKIPLIAGGTTTDEHVLVSMGDEALGIISALHYSAALTTPEAKKFVDGYKSKFGRVPSYYADGTYSAMAALEVGLKGAGGLDDIKAFAKSLQETSITSARGQWKLDSLNNPIQNIYLRKVEKVDGKLQNTVFKTYENVSQFWNYDAKEFLAKPVYSRDYPPVQ